MSNQPIRVLLVDDEPLMLRPLHTFVSAAPDLTVVGQANNGEVAVRRARELSPDVVLMDMQMPIMDGVAATARIRAERPETAVLALTTFASERYVVPALRAGASGYLVKDTNPEELVDAIRATHRGEARITPAVLQHVVAGITDDRPVPRREATALRASLSPRELRVVELLARGLSNREIAAELVVTESTVKAHLTRINDKFGVRDRVQVVVRAAEVGLVEISLRDQL